MKIRFPALLIVCTLLISACGNKGPLTLPPPPAKTASSPPATNLPVDHNSTATPPAR
jgi:predicted small lipoprotein YifL